MESKAQRNKIKCFMCNYWSTNIMAPGWLVFKLREPSISSYVIDIPQRVFYKTVHTKCNRHLFIITRWIRTSFWLWLQIRAPRHEKYLATNETSLQTMVAYVMLEILMEEVLNTERNFQLETWLNKSDSLNSHAPRCKALGLFNAAQFEKGKMNVSPNSSQSLQRNSKKY